MADREMTLGERRVRVAFNPSAALPVDHVKTRTAELIDTMDAASKETGDGEAKRLCALAMTAYEEAAMWAVKALTIGK